jgi:2'-5' RNA ligase
MDELYYWLIPDEPHREKLQETIQNFSHVYRGPSFPPHITLGTGRVIPSTPPRDCYAPTISFTAVQAEEDPFRALYYLCERTPDLDKLRYHVGGEDPYTPHLSLLYGSHSQARRRDWCSHTPLFQKKVSCSTIWIVRGGPKVSQWKMIHSHQLQPAQT